MRGLKPLLRNATCLLVLITVMPIPAAHARPVGFGPGRRSSVPVPFESLDRGLHGTWVEPLAMFASSPDQWDAFMAGLAQVGALDILPPPLAPDVDWTTSTVFLVSLGRRPGGWSAEVIGVRQEGSVAVIQLEIRRPGPDQVDTGWTNTPYDVVRVDATGITSVEVQYEWPSGGAPLLSIAMASMGPVRILAIPESGNPAGPGAGRRVSWGALKESYR